MTTPPSWWSNAYAWPYDAHMNPYADGTLLSVLKDEEKES